MKKDYANHKSHAINAALMGYYRFANLEQAKLQLHILHDQYFISHHALHPDTPECLVLWVRGYALAEDDKKQGLLGHFVKVSCHQENKNQWGFKIEKIVDNAPHPQKRRIPMQHPNWGHPILRNIEKKHVYATLEAAQAELISLQQEYPHVAVPGKHCLFIAIYGRVEDKKAKRVKRYVIEIEAHPEGGYAIIAKEKKQKAKTVKSVPSTPPKTPGDPVGFFTAKIALKRVKKK